MGVNFVSIDNMDNIKNTKNVEIRFICSNCNEESTRTSNAIFYYKVTDCKNCSDNRKQGRFKRKNLNKESLQNIINEKYINKKISFSVVDDFMYQNNKQVINVECTKCGAIIESRIDLLTQGRKSCKCAQLRSKLEFKVNKILENNNFEFETEFTFDDLRHVLLLRYDFTVINNDKIYLIECDGIQHFYPTFGKEAFERTKTTDKIKDDYAKENNIPLLRIKYDTKESIENMILDFINS